MYGCCFFGFGRTGCVCAVAVKYSTVCTYGKVRELIGLALGISHHQSGATPRRPPLPCTSLPVACVPSTSRPPLAAREFFSPSSLVQASRELTAGLRRAGHEAFSKQNICLRLVLVRQMKVAPGVRAIDACHIKASPLESTCIRTRNLSLHFPVIFEETRGGRLTFLFYFLTGRHLSLSKNDARTLDSVPFRGFSGEDGVLSPRREITASVPKRNAGAGYIAGNGPHIS